MSNIKQLAGQTVWYGLSSMGARLLNYLLTPYLTLKLSDVGYGDMSLVYAAVPFLNIIFAYGLETAFFRFSQKEDGSNRVYNTSMVSLICSTIMFTVILLLFRHDVAKLTLVDDHPEYITYVAMIVAFDALATLPFTLLRQQGRPKKFAFVRISGILVNIFSVVFFISYLPSLKASNPNSFLLFFYKEDYQVGYVLIANVIQSFVTLILLSKEFLAFKWKFDSRLWKEIMVYTLPLMIVGFGGVINETMDRLMLGWLLPYSENQVKIETGTYNAVYKLAILITLFIQAFRMGSEPFFFKQAGSDNAQKTYARVMKFFVIAVTGMFLFVSLYIDIWKHFIQKPVYWKGLKVVPILLLANIFLGIYYNLSIWYKLSGRTRAGASITLIGAAITIGINLIFIPHFSYVACAWATFLCYGTMMVISYTWGQKVYPVPYATKKLLAYIVIVVLIFFVHYGLTALWTNQIFSLALATVLMAGYGLFILRIERNEFRRLPVIGKWL